MQRLTVNGRDRQAQPAGERSLLEVLRADFGLTGAKPACGEGECGACTVLLDSEPTRACVTPALEAVGRSVATLEGLAGDHRLCALQQVGLGGALFEAVHFDAGRILNASLSSYRVPRFSDVPPIEIVLLDRPEMPSAGAGETPIIALAPALANAIFAATGRRIRSLPLLSSAALEG